MDSQKIEAGQAPRFRTLIVQTVLGFFCGWDFSNLNMVTGSRVRRVSHVCGAYWGSKRQCVWQARVLGFMGFGVFWLVSVWGFRDVCVWLFGGSWNFTFFWRSGLGHFRFGNSTADCCCVCFFACRVIVNMFSNMFEGALLVQVCFVGSDSTPVNHSTDALVVQPPLALQKYCIICARPRKTWDSVKMSDERISKQQAVGNGQRSYHFPAMAVTACVCVGANRYFMPEIRCGHSIFSSILAVALFHQKCISPELQCLTFAAPKSLTPPPLSRTLTGAPCGA